MSTVVVIMLLIVVALFMIFANSNSPSSSTNVKQLWRFETVGSPESQPIFQNGYLYVNSYFDQSEEGGIYCINATTGSLVWDKVWNTTGNYDRPFSPQLFDNSVYFLTEEGYFYCLNSSTGKQIWNFSSEKAIERPIISQGILFASVEDNFNAFNASNGQKIWGITIAGLSYGQTADNGSIYAVQQKDETHTNSTLYFLNTLNGGIRWNYSIPEYIGTIKSSTNRSLVTSCSMDYINGKPIFRSNIYVLNSATGDKLWNFTTDIYQSNTPNAGLAVSDSRIYLGVGNKTYALDSLSGITVWSRTLEDTYYSYLAFNSYLYVSTNSLKTNGNSSLICLNPESGDIKWNVQLDNRLSSFPIVDSRQIIIGSSSDRYFSETDHHVYSFDPLTGKKIWSTTVAGNPYYPTVEKEIIYVGAAFSTSKSPDFEGNGSIYALEPLKE